jgi:glycosyltransferase involved in cell wall biosynthesis
MSDIHVIHLCEQLERGGLENVIKNLALVFQGGPIGCSVFCTRSGGDTATFLQQRGVSVLIATSPLDRYVKLAKLVVHLKNQDKTLVVHCHGIFATSSEAIFLKIMGIDKWVIQVHNIVQSLSWGQQIKLKILNQAVDSFIAVSGEVGRTLNEFRFKKVEVLVNAVDTNKWEFSRFPNHAIMGFPENSTVIGMVGRVVERKGFDLFLELVRLNEDYCGLIVGEGPYMNRVTSQIEAYKIRARVQCHKFQEDLLPFYACLDYLFLHSTREGLPMALLESQSMGVPFLGNSAGGIPEVVRSGVNGFLVEEKDAKQFAKLVDGAKPGYLEMRKQARKAIEDRFSLTTACKHLAALYKR